MSRTIEVAVSDLKTTLVALEVGEPERGVILRKVADLCKAVVVDYNERVKQAIEETLRGGE
jgi:ribosome maturation factor RimP